jgi:hypothetical protein
MCFSKIFRPKTPSVYKPQLQQILYKAGWTENRNELSIEETYRKIYGDLWIPQAGPFVRSFGHLEMKHTLWVYPESSFRDAYKINKVKSIVGCLCIPIAFSGYMGDGATLWIDEREYFYVVDSEGMVFVGHGIEEALTVLLVPDTKRPPPPKELEEALRGAYEMGFDP